MDLVIPMWMASILTEKYGSLDAAQQETSLTFEIAEPYIPEEETVLGD